MILQALQMGLGVAGAFGAMQKQKEQQRIEEEYNRKAYAGLLKTQDMAQNLNPQASANAAMAHVSDAQTQAMNQAANVGAGQAAASGNGGDVNMGQIASLKAAAPMGAVAAQFGGQKAQIEQNAMNEQQQKVSQMGDVNSRIAQLSQNVNYVTQNKPTILSAITGGLAGINAATDAARLVEGTGSAMSTKDAGTAGDAVNAQAAAMPNATPAPGMQVPLQPNSGIQTDTNFADTSSILSSSQALKKQDLLKYAQGNKGLLSILQGAY